MKKQFPHFSTPQTNRRQFLKLLGGGASLALLSACQPAAAPAAAPATQSGSAAATERSPWVTGNLPSDTAALFRYSAWEGEAEMRKWLFHFDNFFKENYPNMQIQGTGGCLGVNIGPRCQRS